MEVFHKALQAGTLKLEISIIDRSNTILYVSPEEYQDILLTPYSVTLTARDEDDKRIWQTPVMDDHGNVRYYNTVQEAVEDVRIKLGESGEGLQYEAVAPDSELKILLIEDIPEDVELMSMALRKAGLNFHIRQVDTQDEFMQALDEYKADIILSDHATPQFNSLEALSMARKVNPAVPFIVVSGGVSEALAASFIRQGVNDYVLKSDLHRLPLAIQKAMRYSSNALATREELLTKIEALSKANGELESMIYGVTHNLRSPLNSVLGLLDLAKQEGVTSSKSLAHYFQMIESSIRKLDTSINDVLKLAKISKNEPVLEKIDFRKILDDGLEQMRFLKGFDRLRKQIEINQSCLFYSDNYRVSAILNNLLSNAIKYMDNSKAEPFVNIQVDITKETATITITDNGIGINKAYLSKIFSMFYRATSQGEGTGLGLYLVKDTVQALKGTVEIESKEGDGTTFRITLPNQYSTILR
ncbi:MAG TPA: HAMP domain-containing sensor histidine kinase [Ohtaekwangia sp.]|uniref:ATP-binding response regulator n=1 Tax=Ohtaekwangia sp. TaxID=2066019 RepID=UPI002F94D05B